MFFTGIGLHIINKIPIKFALGLAGQLVSTILVAQKFFSQCKDMINATILTSLFTLISILLSMGVLFVPAGFVLNIIFGFFEQKLADYIIHEIGC